MKQWNKKNDQKKNINHYLDNSATKEFIQALIDDDETIRNYEKPINQIFIKYNAKTNKDGSKEPGAVWMSPYMFLDFAMWLNPAFKVKVLKFISDEGFILDYDSLIAYLRKVWHSRNTPKVLIP